MNNRVTLLETLRDTVQKFSSRGTVGRMRTEHVIFIPSALMAEESQETEDFIKAARYITNKKEWNCPIIAEKKSMVNNISGIEFIFQFNIDTDYVAIVDYIESRL